MAKAKATELTEAEITAQKESIGAIEQQALGWTKVLSLKRQIKREGKEEVKINDQIAKLGKDQVENAKKAETATKRIASLNQLIAKATAKDDKAGLEILKIRKAKRDAELKDVMKTTGGALKMKELEARQTRASLTAERELIKSINKERGVGGKIADLFRTKETKARRNEIAQIKAGGTGVVAAGGAGGGKGGDGKGGKAAVGGIAAALGIAGLVAGISAISAKFAVLGKTVTAVGGVMKSGLNAPLQSASALISGDALGMGGGAVSGAGATSMLGGLQSIASSIPFIGGLLGGLVGAFKGLVDAVLGVDQANMRVARSMNISKEAAETMRVSFDKTAAASGNIVVNSTRMLQSQVEIGNQLGINKQLSDDILVNDVKLRDIAGVEAGSRQAIAQSSIITGRSAESITKSVIGQVGAFNKMVGTSFKFSAILTEASKLSGVMGLTFAKYPEKILRATAGVKTMGLEMANMNGIADSLLDFEGSISKEMEAQVLTGMDLNLTKAREAALNNDYLGLATEITKNVGSTANFLGMNRIRQEGIAAAVGMTADSLADVLKKQELYSKLGATDLKTAQAKIALFEKQGKTQKDISKIIGEDGYEMISQVTTAERLAEIMEKIKKVFVDFVKNSGLFDFLTNPEKMGDFIKSMSQKLAGTVSMIGDIIATMLDGVSHLPFTDKDKWQDLANQVRSGAGGLAGTISSTGASVGGAVAASIGGTMQQGATQTAAQAAAAGPAQPFGMMAPQPIVIHTMLDGHTLATSTTEYIPQLFGPTTK